MAGFEKYHPLLSEHYQLDWLTQYYLKDVYRLRQDRQQAEISGRHSDETIEETARYVNKSMRLIMSDEALLYGIADRRTNTFVGSVCLWNFDKERTTAQLRFEALDDAPQAVFDEIIPRISGFAFFELGLTSLYVLIPSDATVIRSALEDAGYTATTTDKTRKTASGARVPIIKLSLTRAAVEGDERFNF